ncbi:Protein fam72a [Lobulomyces angularis]|nr:Protein fam72a [Lobulomyces angularis]
MSSNEQNVLQPSERSSGQISNPHTTPVTLYDVIAQIEPQSSRFIPRTNFGDFNIPVRTGDASLEEFDSTNNDSVYTYQSTTSNQQSILDARRLMRNVMRNDRNDRSNVATSNISGNITRRSRTQSPTEIIADVVNSYARQPLVSVTTARFSSRIPQLTSNSTGTSTSAAESRQNSLGSRFSDFQNAVLTIEPTEIFERSYLAATRGSAHARPQFQAKAVCQLSCKYCFNDVCRRGMKAILLADMAVELFSTDMPPSGVSLVNDDYQTRKCHCRIKDVACLGCGNVIGYHVTQPCQSCMDACNNGHFWMFHVDHVNSTERTDCSGTLLWANLSRADADVEKFDAYNAMCR